MSQFNAVNVLGVCSISTIVKRPESKDSVFCTIRAAEGHPSAVMDMSFANQVLCAVHLATQAQRMDNSVHAVPVDIDQEVARLKLAAMNIRIDTLTDGQARYLSSWQEGT
jgi:adenosylhomocysteinase